MKNINKLLVSASGLSIAVLGFQPAFAAGTTAGSSITNNVSVAYQVGGVTQTNATASDTFVVDRKVNIIVAEEGNVTTSVSPGQTNAVTTFLVTNATNETMDVNLTSAEIVGGTAKHGGTDTFNATNRRIYVDTNNNGTFESGTDQLVTYLDELLADQTRRVFIVVDIPLGRVTGDVAGVSLTGTAREGGTANSQGAAVTQTATPTAGKDTVFADSDGVYDGAATDRDDYTVQAAALSALKGSTVLAANYPITGATQYFNIPGATVQYCIAVRNSAGGAAASNVAISDVLPLNTTYVANTIRIGGTVVINDNGTPANLADDTITSCDNSTGVVGDGAYAAGTRTVTGTIGTVGAGTANIVTFNATIN